MGATPQKDSPTGREVIRRMYLDNPSDFKFPKESEEDYKEYLFDDSLYITDDLPDGFLNTVKFKDKFLTNYDMGHKEDAVLVWNNFFRKLGEEEGKKLARKWMYIPENYELQDKSDNRSKGARIGHTENGRYKHPETDSEKIKVAKEEYKTKIDKINEDYEKIKAERKEKRKEKKEKRRKDGT